ncbi:MAG: hypothetical protein ACYC7D_08435 [Nitrososphaerales archaeon]
MPQDSKQPEKKAEAVTIYGLSSEGYGIASKLASKGLVVYLIDETLGTAMELRPEVAGDYRELRQLLSDEILMNIKSSKECIANSNVIFFTPKIRRSDEDILAEVKGRISDLSKHISCDTLLVFCLPLGISGTKEIIERVEHASGLVSGKDFMFSYSPIESGRPNVFGSNSNLVEYAPVIEAAGFSMEIFPLPKAEIVHAQKLVARYSALASTFESAKRLVQMGFDCPREYKQIFSDDISGMLYDLRLVSKSLETGDPILYLVSGSLKSVESYARFLVERIRDFVRIKELKASRLRILLFTDSDQLEMRGDRISLGSSLQDKLRDFYSDIELLNIMKEGFTLPMGMEKINLMIFLSGSSEQRIMQLYEDQISMTKAHIIRANLPVEYVS